MDYSTWHPDGIYEIGSTFVLPYAVGNFAESFDNKMIALPAHSTLLLPIRVKEIKNLLRVTDLSTEGRCCCCGQEAQSACQKCMVAKYCTRQCQLGDWPTHKKYCPGKPSHSRLLPALS